MIMKHKNKDEKNIGKCYCTSYYIRVRGILSFIRQFYYLNKGMVLGFYTVAMYDM